MAHIGLYFGSFNPIHTGHLIVARHMLDFGPFSQIWFVVSPHNPFKQQDDLMPAQQRLAMVQAAIAGEPQFHASDVEFGLSQPSYTMNTLEHLKQTTEHSFGIIMGSDNLEKLQGWKDIDRICELCDFHVYGRRGYLQESPLKQARMHFHEAPMIDISATYIRGLMKSGHSLKYLVPDAVISMLKGEPTKIK